MERKIDIESILTTCERQLTYFEKDKLYDQISKLNSMSNEDLPHLGEKLIASIIGESQKIIDLQTKLSRYIKNQQIIILLNYYINKEKAIDAYTYITFEIRKLILFIKDSNYEMNKLEEELTIMILALRECIKRNTNVINNPLSVINNDVLMKLNILKRQCKMLEDYLCFLISNNQSQNELINEYDTLYDKYDDLTKKYYTMNIYSLDSYKYKSDYFLKWHLNDKKFDLLAYTFPYLRKRQQNIIALKLATLINAEKVIDIIHDEQDLKLFSVFCLLIETPYGLSNIPNELIEELFDIDTMNSKDPNISQVINDNFHDFNTIWNSYNCDFSLKKARKIAYIKCLIYSLSKKSLNSLFNNNETKDIFNYILKEFYDYNRGIYDINYDAINNNNIKSFLNLPDALKGEVVITKKLFDEFFEKNSKNMDLDNISINDIKIWLLDNCFKSFSDYLGINYDDNYVKKLIDQIGSHYSYHSYKDSLLSNIPNLTDEISYAFYLIFYLSFLDNKIYKKNRHHSKELFLCVLERIKKIYQNFGETKIINIVKIMRELFTMDEMTALLELADEIPDDNSKLKAYYRWIVRDNDFLGEISYCSIIDSTLNEVINYFTKKEKNKSLIR